jgi:GMP synthase (glutamine-hydrolysing)
VDEIRRVVGEGTALCAISGGVDSGVCAMLGHKAIGMRLKCIFVDTGLLRKGESDFVMSFYRDALGLNIVRVDAADRFLRELSGIVDSERKSLIVMRLLQEILNAEVSKTPDVNVLLQGTNYSDYDVISAGETPISMSMRSKKAILVEPVRELFKDEIRRVGEEMGMPLELTSRQPFPGAGLAMRILGDVTSQRLQVLREADAIFLEEVAQSGQGKRLWQHFAVLSDMALGGLSGMAICLRAVHASESSPAMAARLPFDLLERVSSRILKALPQVVRVVYDLTPSRNFAGIEWQ